VNRSSRLTLTFASLFLVFFILLVFLRFPLPLYHLLSWQDALDLLTPLVLIPIYWRMLRSVTRDLASPNADTAFMILSALWVLGQGMHLAANSVNNLIAALAKTGALDITGTDIFTLVYFLDENLSHSLWHLGVLGLAALLIYEAWHPAASDRTDWAYVMPAAFLHGITLFLIIDEGNTVWIGLPFTLAVTLTVLARGTRKLSQQPVLAFFFTSCLIALLVFLGWGIHFRGFPPVMDVLNI